MAINPLTPEHAQAMQHHIQFTPTALEFLQKCHDCGLDTAQRQEAVKAQHEFFSKVIQNFFPDGTPIS